MNQTETDQHFMSAALELAGVAGAAGEVPVGAVVVRDGEIIGRGFNQPISRCDPAAHAEIIAIRAAAGAVGNYRLSGASLYVTLEPCVMCVGAIVHARIARLVFAAADERSGAAGGAVDLLAAPFFNHRCRVTRGVDAAAAAAMLREFFVARRGGDA